RRAPLQRNDSSRPRPCRSRTARLGNGPVSSRQVGLAHQVPIALPRRPAALVDGPDHQALPPPHVPPREHPLNARPALAALRLGVGEIALYFVFGAAGMLQSLMV